MIEMTCWVSKNYVPWSVNYFDDRVRNCVYMMFLKNTPEEVHRFLRRFRFRLLFQWTEDEIPDIHNLIIWRSFVAP